MPPGEKLERTAPAKGLRVRVLKGCARTHQYLVYVYRESMLRAVLTDETVQGFLRQEGYHLRQNGRLHGLAHPAFAQTVLLGRIPA